MANVPQWVPFVVFLVIIVVPHLVTVLVQLDIWPYSHYPMYSQKKAVDLAAWFHVTLERADGTKRRWIPSHIRFSREVNRAFAKLERARAANPQDLEALLDIIERRVCDDHPRITDFATFTHLAIIRVTCPGFRSGDVSLLEEVRFRRALPREASRQLETRATG